MSDKYWVNWLEMMGGKICNIPNTDSLNQEELRRLIGNLEADEDVVAIFIDDENHKPLCRKILVDVNGQRVPQKPFVMTEPSGRHNKFTLLCIQGYAKYGHEYWTKGSVYKGEYIGAKSCIVETNFGDKKRVGLGHMLCGDGIDKYFKVVEEE